MLRCGREGFGNVLTPLDQRCEVHELLKGRSFIPGHVVSGAGLKVQGSDPVCSRTEHVGQLVSLA